MKLLDDQTQTRKKQRRNKQFRKIKEYLETKQLSALHKIKNISSPEKSNCFIKKKSKDWKKYDNWWEVKKKNLKTDFTSGVSFLITPTLYAISMCKLNGSWASTRNFEETLCFFFMTDSATRYSLFRTLRLINDYHHFSHLSLDPSLFFFFFEFNFLRRRCSVFFSMKTLLCFFIPLKTELYVRETATLYSFSSKNNIC